MHKKYSLITRLESEADVPSAYDDAIEDIETDDSDLTKAVFIDSGDQFVGRVSPRVIQWLIDRVRELRLGTGS